mgnify:CR=1 FL=1
MQTQRVTMAQALVGFLKNQYVERDGQEQAAFQRLNQRSNLGAVLVHVFPECEATLRLCPARS